MYLSDFYNEIINNLISAIQGHFNISSTRIAKKLLFNAINYNVVSSEILVQVKYLIENDIKLD